MCCTRADVEFYLQEVRYAAVSMETLVSALTKDYTLAPGVVGSCQVMDNQPLLFWKTTQYVSLIQLLFADRTQTSSKQENPSKKAFNKRRRKKRTSR